MPAWKGGKGAVARFEREMQQEILRIFEVDVKAAVDEIALNVRHNAQQQTVAVGAVDTGHLERGWMAGPGVDKNVSVGGEGAARAALQRRKTGESAFVYNNDFVGWFIEQGWHDRAGVFHGPRPILRAAVWQERDRVIRV